MRCSAWLLSALLLTGALTPIEAIARGGGGGGGGHGGGGYGGGGRGWGGGGDGGGGYHVQGGDLQGGYGGAHGMYGDGARPAYNNDTINRTVNVQNNFYNRDGNGWNGNWRNGGYWNNRPWNAGWYGGWGGWGWWGGSAAAWGIAGLATGAAITSLVNAAANNSSAVILVPATSYMLNYGSVDVVGSNGASFFYTVNGTELIGAANCRQGLLNGQVPSTADQAQLLNAVCQVAFGSGG